MNKYILLAVLALAVAAPSYAQAGHHKGTKHCEKNSKNCKCKHTKHKNKKDHSADFKNLNR